MPLRHTIYWIRHKSHTDFMSQGYIGVTSNLKQRIRHHFKNAINGYHTDKVLTKAIIKYGKDEILCDILLFGNKNYCYMTEHLMRPKAFIGWNMREGGYHTPNCNPKGNKIPKEWTQKGQETVKKRRANGEIVGNQRKVYVNNILFNSVKDARNANGISASQMKRLLKRTPDYNSGNIKFQHLVVRYAATSY